MAAMLTFETRPVLSLTVGANRLGERARLPVSLMIVSLRIWDGSCVETFGMEVVLLRLGALLPFVPGNKLLLSSEAPSLRLWLLASAQQMLVWNFLSLLGSRGDHRV